MHRIILTLIILFFISSIATSGQSSDSGYFLLNEISPWPSDDVVWVELINPTNNPAELSGYSITFYSGFTYTFPADSGTIEPGNLHVLQITGENILNESGDACILNGPDGPADAVSWGTLSDYTDVPLYNGSPLLPSTGIVRDSKIYSTGDVLIRIPGTTDSSADNWVWRGEEAASHGSPNPPPPPARLSPADGSTFASGVTLYATGVDWADKFTFQIASDNTFTDIILEEITSTPSLSLENIEPGTYFWRIKIACGDLETWTQPVSFIRDLFDIEELIEMQSRNPDDEKLMLARVKGGQSDQMRLTWHVLPCTHMVQAKDTGMLCLDGCMMSGDCPWCEEHFGNPDEQGNRCKHGDSYCTRACISMAASTAGLQLSQDRVTYYLFEEAQQQSKTAIANGHIGDPFKDLGHGAGTHDDDVRLLVARLYGQPVSNTWEVNFSDELFDDLDRSDMDTVREYILDGRPIVFSSDKHSVLIAGVALTLDTNGDEHRYVKIYDPWLDNHVGWKEWKSGDFYILTFPPKTGALTWQNEPEIFMDSDNDGIIDFDELKRFKTDPNNPDSDLDGVNDREDILGYIFNPDGSYHRRNPDIDGDGVWKELDIDNDWANDMGEMDGCEDWNYDGFCDNAIESDCFNAGDDYSIMNPECISGLFRYEQKCVYQDDESITTFDYLESIVIEEGSFESNDFIHKHLWTFSAIQTPYSPDGFSQYAYKTGTGPARVVIQPDESGEYFATIEINPNQDSVLAIVDWPAENEHHEAVLPLMHHFSFFPTFSLGTPIRTPGGALILKGELDLEGQTIQGTNNGFQLNENCTLKTCWEIILEPPPAGS